MPPFQESRPFEVVGPLDPDVLMLLHMTGQETLGRPFEYNVDLLSEDHNIAIPTVLGQGMAIRANLADDEVRHFHGIVTRFAYVGVYGRFARYQATLRPWLWLLTRDADCRIFQTQSVETIIRTVLSDHGFTDISVSLNESYEDREYCTQYRETDFDFVSRLMEHEGMYYFFEHEENKHTIKIADDISAHAAPPGYEEVPFFVEGGTTNDEDDRFLTWDVEQEIQTTTIAHNDFDFEKPKSPLETRSEISKDHAEATWEKYDYPGLYKETTPGENIARVRIQEQQAEYEFGYGTGTARGLYAGCLFSLVDHPRGEVNREYLVVSATYELHNPEFESENARLAEQGFEADTPEHAFICKVVVIDSRTRFRPMRSTPVPVVKGIQTATICGSGDDVWTDQYGRVKVQFHWDREGGSDENSSCWLRVSQNWAGKNWGGMFIPHIGQEVIVDFLEGNPDRPMVTGRVYNADNMPPLDLPDAKLKSIIRDNFGNQILFNAAPGEEHIEIFSPHHDSRLEIGRSARIFSVGPFVLNSQDKLFQAVAGFKSGIFLGDSVSLTAGLAADVFLGFKFGFHGGGKIDLFAGTQVSCFWGDKLDIAKGLKVSKNDQSEVKHTSAEVCQRSMGNTLIDSKLELTLNAGDKDNSLINMSKDAILIDFGKDADKEGSDADAEADKVKAAAKMLWAQAAAWAAGALAVASPAVTASAYTNRTADGQSSSDASIDWETVAGAGSGVLGGVLLAKAKLWKKDQKLIRDIADTMMGGSEAKTTQDETYGRISLSEQGIKIATHEGGKPEKKPDADTGTGYILIKKTGEIEIKAPVKGVTIESKTDMAIKCEAALSIEATEITMSATQGDVTIDGTNIKGTATADATWKGATVNGN